MKTKVYILGAGASKPAGCPLIKDFIGEGFFHLINNSAFPDNLSNYIEFCKYLKEKYKFDFCNSGRSDLLAFLCYQKIDIETIISELDKEIRQGKKDLIEARRQAVRFVYATLENAARDGSNEDCYPDFVKNKIVNLDDEHVIITFNYETCLEKAIQDKFRYYFSYLLDVDKDKIIHFHSYQKKYTNNLKILKLHGSLNWAICSGCNKIHLFWSHKYDDIFKEKCKNCDHSLDSILIAPTKYKELDKNLEKLWDIAREKIIAADEIVIIGYAFNEYDKEAFKLFGESIKCNKKSPMLFIADPNACDIYKKITSNFSVKDENFSNRVFSQGFREYINICL